MSTGRAGSDVFLRIRNDLISSVEEGEHNVLNLFLEVAGQCSSGMLVESLFEDEEQLARTEL